MLSTHAKHCVSVASLAELLDQSEQLFKLVWRVDFGTPGFAAIELPAGVDSHTLRAWMVALKRRLSDFGVAQGRGPIGYLSMARFDQQITTKFHLDGAPDKSLLMLGYEASPVQSRLFLADFTRAAFDRSLTPREFLRNFNPMYRAGEESLAAYITELPAVGTEQSRIVLINNSALPFDLLAGNPLGVLHKATIDVPDETRQRIINSTMLALDAHDAIGPAQQEEFVTTTEISKKVY